MSDNPQETDVLPEDAVDENYYPEEWTIWTRRMMSIGLVIAGLLSLSFLTPILGILIGALLLTFLLFIPIVAICRRTNLPYAGVTLIVFFSYLLVIFFLLINLLPQVIELINNLAVSAQELVDNLNDFLLTYDPATDALITLFGVQVNINSIVQPLAESVQAVETSGLAPETVGLEANILLGGVAAVASLLGSVVGVVSNLGLNFFLIHLTTILFLLELPSLYRQLYETRATLRREWMLLLGKVYNVWVAFFRVQVVTGVIIGTLTWLQLIVMGIPGATVIGVFTALTSLIPNVGGFFALVPIFFVPLFEGSTVFTDMDNLSVALLVVAVNFLLQQIFWNIIVPKMTSDALQLSLPVVILGVFVGAALGGMIGAFLVVPIMGTVKMIVSYTLGKLHGGDPYPGEVEPELWTGILITETTVGRLKGDETSPTESAQA